MGVYARGEKLWIRFRDVGGKWRDAFSGHVVGQEAAAAEVHRELVAQVAATEKERAARGPVGMTVRKYAESWIVKRRERELDWRNDESRLRHHILPTLGDLAIADVRTRHLVDLFHKLRIDREKDLSPRTIYNIYSVASALFRDAKLADLIDQTPCELDERQLGPLKRQGSRVAQHCRVRP